MLRGTLTRRLAVALVAALVGLGVFGLMANAQAPQSSDYDAFPLYKDVPGESFARLGEGKLSDGTRWAAYASRGIRANKGRMEPCLSVARITRFGEYGNASQCGPLAPDGSGSGPPPVYVSISGSYDTKPGGKVIGESVNALSFKTSVEKVALTFSTGDVLTRRTKLFNSKQRAKAHLTGFRYLAIGMQRDICVTSVTGFNHLGAVILQEDTSGCPG